MRVQKIYHKNKTIEAIQWDGNSDTFLNIRSFCGDTAAYHTSLKSGTGIWYIYTKEGTEIAKQFDWIIKDKDWNYSVKSQEEFSAMMEE